MRTIILSCITLLLCINIYSKDDSARNKQKLQKILSYNSETYLDINNIFTPVFNYGKSDANINTNLGGLEYPKGSGKTSVFSSGFLWGAFVNNDAQYRIGGVTYNTGLQAGIIKSDGTADDPTLAKYRTYRVRPDVYPGGPSVDLTQDAIYENRSAAAIRAQYEQDWNEWPADEGAPFTDVNNDGIYEPGTDIPGVSGADQTIWYVCNDMNSSLTTYLYGTLPMGIELQTTIWAYKQQGILSNIYFKKYRIINKGYYHYTLDSTFVSLWADPDVGTASNDLVGSDSALSLIYAYNGNPVDAVYSPFPPPAVGFSLLQGPAVNGSINDTAIINGAYIVGKKNLPMSSAYFFNNGDSNYNDPYSGDPSGATQFYHFFRGENGKTGLPIVNPVTNQQTGFVFSGNPLTNTGWLDGQTIAPGDRRQGFASGPFKMAPGDTQEVVFAEMVGEGVDYLNAIRLVKYYSLNAKSIYKNFFKSITETPEPASPGCTLENAQDTIRISWGNSALNPEENFSNSGYGFEGYNVYQLSNPLNFKENAVRIATFDKINGIKSIEGKIMDPATGMIVNGTQQFGNDTGLQYNLNVARDFITNTALIQGRKYYYAVTAYTYNPNNILPNNTESPLQVKSVNFQDSVMVTFQVNMGAQIFNKYWNPVSDSLFVIGDFQKDAGDIHDNWNGTAFRLKRASSGDSIYISTIILPDNSYISKQYHYAFGKITGSAIDTETITRRSFTVAGLSTVLPAYYFNNDSIYVPHSLYLITETEPNNNMEQANQLIYGDTVWGNINYNINDVDYFKFTAQAGDTVLITPGTLRNSNFPWACWLEDSLGNYIDDSYYLSNHKRIINILQNSGTYYIHISECPIIDNIASNNAKKGTELNKNISLTDKNKILSGKKNKGKYLTDNISPENNKKRITDITGSYQLILSKYMPSKPEVILNGVSDVNWNSIRFSYNLNPNGSSTQLKLIFGTDTVNLRTKWDEHLYNSINEIYIQSDTVSGLQPNTLYYYKIEAVNSLGSSYSNYYIFYTQLKPDSITKGNCPVTNYLKKVFFADKLHGWAIGDSNLIYTTDGGMNWFLNDKINSYRGLNSISFGDVMHGTIVSSDGIILRTVDGGNTWTEQSSSLSSSNNYSFRDVIFTDSLNGTVVGYQNNINTPIIIYTIDGGKTWLQQSTGLTNVFLESVNFTDPAHGTIVGFDFNTNYKGIILHTIDGGSTWQLQNSGLNISGFNQFFDVFFTDPLHGTIIGYDNNSYGLILHTSDGGDTWQQQNSGLSIYYNNLTEVCFSDSLHGIIVGSYGLIMQTSDAGKTWQLRQSGTTNDLLAVTTLHDNQFISVGQWGTILNGNIITSTNEQKNTLPDKFELSQNYPNPFNPVTTINYSVPKPGTVTIKIYDILGREVITLVNEDKKAGSCKINFNAGSLASGVYFYKMKAGDFVQVKKMLLLK